MRAPGQYTKKSSSPFKLSTGSSHSYGKTAFFVTATVLVVATAANAILGRVCASFHPSGKLRSQVVPDLQIYDTPSGATFLQQIDPSTFTPRGTVTIDYAHRLGKLHIGACLLVADLNGKILLLRRGPHLVTCPNAWGIVGEHSQGDEGPLDNVKRGMVEELGERAWDDVESVRNLTALPVYMVRTFGDRGRVDRQLLYMWEVRMKKRQEELRLKLDEEVAQHQWIDLNEYEKWVKEDVRYNPPRDFCHPVVAGLRSFEIDRLKLLRASEEL